MIVDAKREVPDSSAAPRKWLRWATVGFIAIVAASVCFGIYESWPRRLSNLDEVRHRHGQPVCRIDSHFFDSFHKEANSQVNLNMPRAVGTTLPLEEGTYVFSKHPEFLTMLDKYWKVELPNGRNELWFAFYPRAKMAIVRLGPEGRFFEAVDIEKTHVKLITK